MNWPVFYIFPGPVLVLVAAFSILGMDVLLERHFERRALRSKAKSEGTTERLHGTRDRTVWSVRRSDRISLPNSSRPTHPLANG
ncbi:hypothetical protein SAMN05519103_03991 [Rhizobiales bacterium GAS113]|nr:hypothetical protein SAMN05519103_03991 [Rhizobiales bacterium GAS113]